MKKIINTIKENLEMMKNDKSYAISTILLYIFIASQIATVVIVIIAMIKGETVDVNASENAFNSFVITNSIH